MAVAEQITINRYVGNNSTIEFPFTFFCLDNDTLKVFVNGVEQAEDVDYTVAGIGNPSGGTITFAEAPPSAAAVIIFRETPIVRNTDYLDGGAITADILDYDQDYQTLILQEIKSRAIYITGEFTVDLQGARIINLGAGINPTDAVTKGYADTILTQTQGYATDAAASAAAAQAAADIAVPAGVTAQNAANDALISENNAFNSAQQATAAAASATVSAGLAEQFADDAEASAILAQNAALPMTLRGYVDDTGPYGGDCGYETLTTVSTLNIINAVNVMNGGGDCGMFPRWNFVGVGEVDLDTGISLLQPKFTISENGSVVNTSFGIGRIDFVGANVTANTKSAGDGLHTVTVEIAGSVPPGADTEIVFNDGGAYGTDSAFTFNKTTDTLTIGSLVVNGSTGQVTSAGTIEVDANAVDIAGGQVTLSSANIASLEGHFGAKKVVVSEDGINLVFNGKPLLIGGSAGTSGYVLKTAGAGAAPSWGQVELSQTTGTLPISQGGTGQTTANAALNALLPAQALSTGQFLQTDGTNASWVTVGGGPTYSVQYKTVTGEISGSLGLLYGTTGGLTVVNETEAFGDARINGGSGTQDFYVRVTPTIGGSIQAGSLYLVGGDASNDLPGDVHVRGGLNIPTVGDPGPAADIFLEYFDSGYQTSLRIDGEFGAWHVGPTEDAGTAGQVLTSNGSGAAPTWQTPVAGLSAPNYEEFVATASQTVFNTTMTTTAKAAGKAYLQVFVNGVLQMEGATKKFTVTGANQITFNTGLDLDDDVVIYGYA